MTDDELTAGDLFRETLIPLADAHAGPYPLWHGWAILDAFRAAWQRERDRAADRGPADAPPAR